MKFDLQSCKSSALMRSIQETTCSVKLGMLVVQNQELCDIFFSAIYCILLAIYINMDIEHSHDKAHRAKWYRYS